MLFVINPPKNKKKCGYYF